MDKVKFYLAGGMGGLPIEEQVGWRNEIEEMIRPYGEDVDVSTYFFSPPYYYQPGGNYHKSEKEARDYDLDKLRHSDVVIVNFNAPNSIGTAQELAIAYEYRIPVIGLNENSYKLHPWLCECCTRICENKQELLEHIVNYYLT